MRTEQPARRDSWSLCSRTPATQYFWGAVKCVRRPVRCIPKISCPAARRIRRTLSAAIRSVWATLGDGPATQRIWCLCLRPALAARSGRGRSVWKALPACVGVRPAVCFWREAEWVRGAGFWAGGATGGWVGIWPTLAAGKHAGIWSAFTAGGHTCLWSAVTAGGHAGIRSTVTAGKYTLIRSTVTAGNYTSIWPALTTGQCLRTGIESRSEAEPVFSQYRYQRRPFTKPVWAAITTATTAEYESLRGTA